jgi:ubiquinone/menaquinone biosynthesis C-methylase UbiE
VARARGRGPVLTGDALTLPVGSGSLDVVVCSMAIMLLRPIDPAMAEVTRVLRLGARSKRSAPSAAPCSGATCVSSSRSFWPSGTCLGYPNASPGEDSAR